MYIIQWNVYHWEILWTELLLESLVVIPFSKQISIIFTHTGRESEKDWIVPLPYQEYIKILSISLSWLSLLLL